MRLTEGDGFPGNGVWPATVIIKLLEFVQWRKAKEGNEFGKAGS